MNSDSKSDSDNKCDNQQQPDICNENGETPLHLAAISNNANDVKRLLDSGVDPNVLDKFGNSPLHKAVVAKAAEVVQVMLRYSATDLNAPRKDGETPLILALNFMGQEKQLINDLIKAGANVNAESVKRGTTTLHWATIHNCLDLVAVLLKNRANVNARDGHGRTPLHYAMPTIAKSLLDAGANAIAQDHGGHTPLHLAVLGRDTIIFQALLNHTTNLNTRTLDGSTPLITAVNIGMESMTVDLMSAGADVDAMDLTGMTALHRATLHNCINLVAVLLQNGPNLNIRDNNGCTPLHYAKSEIAKKLLDAGADAVIQNNDGRTPLHLAVMTSNMSVFQLLLPKTTDLNNRTRDGITPLMSAVHMGLDNMAIDLISAGADVNTADHKGMTALHRAALLNRLNLVNVLLQNGATLNVQDYNCSTPLHYAKADIARNLIDAGADANVKTNTGFTPLHVAVVTWDTTLFKILLQHTTHLNTRCAYNSMTPLTDAVKNAMENVVRDLLQAGADVSVNSGRGMTALHWAANFSELPNCEDAASSRATAAKMLLDAGADANARNFSGDTPLHIALKTKAWPVFEVLLQHKSTDLNASDVNGKTLLMMILESDSECKVETFEDLIKTGASIHERDNEQMTALHYAAKFGRFDELNLLLKYGADINAADQSKMTALHWAISFHILVGMPMQKEANLIAPEGCGQTSSHYDKTDIIESLLDAGADTITQDFEGRTPLNLAVMRRDMNVFQILLGRTRNLNTPTYRGMSPLITAVDLGMEDMVLDLISAGADVNATNRDKATALHFAAGFSNSKNSENKANSRANVARMLLDAGANPNLGNNFGDTPLHTAVKTKTWPVFQILLRNKRTDLNTHNILDDRKTPLMMILERDVETEIFEDLIKAGASVHETDRKGKTALHYATVFNKCTELDLLLNIYNADVNATDESGNTAVLLAAELDLLEAYALLVKNCKVNVNVQRPSDGKTLLMLLIESNIKKYDFASVAEQVESVHVTDKKLQTALHYAAKLNKIDAIITLVHLDADINARDCEGRTPLFVAAREGNYQSCFNLKSVYYANSDIPDNKDRSPIDVAREENHTYIVAFFNENMPAG